MRALRFHGPKDLRVEHDVKEPTCAEHQIKIKPAFVGICGTDLHEYSTPTFFPMPGKPHPVTGEEVPVGVGHEFSGTVVEIGSQVKNAAIKVGDKVAIQPTICCHGCGSCKDGLLNCCDNFGFIGLSGWGGGMSDFVCVDANFVFRLPDHIDLDVGGKYFPFIATNTNNWKALVEPLAVAWHAVGESQIQPGEDALVLGAGPIGLGVIQCLKARGAKQIVVAEVAAQRQKFAKHFGATTVLDPRHDDIVVKSKELCEGRGPHVALDCAGVPQSIKSAVLAVRGKGRIVNVAIWEKEVPFQPNDLIFGEKKYSAGMLLKLTAGLS